MEIETTMRYHFTLVRMAIITKSTNNSAGEVVEKGEPWETVWNFLKKLKVELPFNSAIPLLRLHSKNPETPIENNLCIPTFTAAQFIIAKYWKQPKCPSVNELIKNFGTFTQWNTTQQRERRSSYPLHQHG